jgi:hypothetical protein
LKEIENEKAFLICSGSLGEEFVHKVHDQAVVESIYVFCGNKAKHEQWARQYPKVKGVYTKIEFLCKQLKTEVQQTESSFFICLTTIKKSWKSLSPTVPTSTPIVNKT